METFPKKLLSCNLKKKATSSSLDFVPSGKANGSQSYSKKVTFKEITSEENVLDDSFTGVPIESVKPQITTAGKNLLLQSPLLELKEDPWKNYENSITVIKRDRIIQDSMERTHSTSLSPLLAQKSDGKTYDKSLRKNLFFNPNYETSTYMTHLKAIHKDSVYSIRGLKHAMNFEKKKISLCEKKDKNKKTLFLDLDETLVHSCSLDESPMYILNLDCPKTNNKIGVNIRPYCSKFLKHASKYYEIFVFTASTHIYADAIVNIIDPNKVYIRGILSRNHCLRTKFGFFVKDLSIIENRDLKDIIIVDDCVHSFALQINNGIPILKWIGDQSDQELKYLFKYLLKLANCQDVRDMNKSLFSLEELANISLQELLEY